jgi:trehalose 6-phosphate synthase
MADAIARALAMPLEERKERHAAMLKSVVEEDVRWWSARFIAALTEPEPSESRPPLTLASSQS